MEFTGKFEGGNEEETESRAMVYLGTLQKVDECKKKDKEYRIEMGAMDLPGHEVTDLKEEDRFLYT